MSLKKKVLLAVTKSVWGGAQRYVYDLALNLPSEKYEVLVLAGGEGPLIQKLRASGLKTITLPTLQEGRNFFRVILAPSNLLWPFRLLKIFLKERPQIIHFSSSKMIGLGGLAAFFYQLLTFDFKLVTVATIHGWPFRERRFWSGRLVIFLFSWMATLFQKKIILINADDLKTAKKFIPSKKLFLILNGLGPKEFLERGKAQRFFSAKIGVSLKPGDIIVGTIAELTPNKGLDYFLAALKLIKKKADRVRIVGLIIGEGEQKAQLQNMIQSLNMGGVVFLLGFLPDAASLLKGFDIFVLPSLKEGLPYAILEAMAAGLPIVATGVGGANDLIKSGETGILVPPEDSEKLSEAILKLARDQKERSRLGQNAAREIGFTFSLKIMTRKTRKCYET